MTGFKPRTSGIRNDRSTNWATTTARKREDCLAASVLAGTVIHSLTRLGIKFAFKSSQNTFVTFDLFEKNLLT